MAISTPWWQDAAPVVRAARKRLGIEIMMLRLLETELPQPQGGGVTYLAEQTEFSGPACLGTVRFKSIRCACPMRGPAARRPNWTGRSRRWASLASKLTGIPSQMRTWNLSSIWRIPRRRKRSG